MVLDVLEELSQKRLLSSEVETMTSPFKGKISSLNLDSNLLLSLLALRKTLYTTKAIP